MPLLGGVCGYLSFLSLQTLDPIHILKYRPFLAFHLTIQGDLRGVELFHNGPYRVNKLNMEAFNVDAEGIE